VFAVTLVLLDEVVLGEEILDAGRALAADAGPSPASFSAMTFLQTEILEQFWVKPMPPP